MKSVREWSNVTRWARWCPVDELMPIPGRPVLVLTSNQSKTPFVAWVHRGRVGGVDCVFWSDGAHFASNVGSRAVTHWIPLPEPPAITYTADEAFALMDRGVWMTCGGYTLRNLHHADGVCGQYLSGDNVPREATIRSGEPETLEKVRRLGDRWRVVPTSHNDEPK